MTLRLALPALNVFVRPFRPTLLNQPRPEASLNTRLRPKKERRRVAIRKHAGVLFLSSIVDFGLQISGVVPLLEKRELRGTKFERGGYRNVSGERIQVRVQG